ncbi:aminotransferase class I/II-fold pyridoxal phosphate-dependent enzyme [Amycolatopsis sp. EV170708-02-1]|uniref:aminotransferase class I/II-fold pyridoxal phosphate-dependent enzyme n=1 Tax=Amycolatopsis sp. EV170708-02-1 TaxID=2919322 RepID=UPI0037C0267F
MGNDAKALAQELLNRHGSAAPSRTVRRTGLAGHAGIQAAKDLRSDMDDFFTKRGMPSPFFLEHEGVNGAVTTILDREVINFSGFNYLGLAGHPVVRAAAKAAIDTYGTSASASRTVAGEIPLYPRLERKLADAYGVDDAVLAPSGYLTNAAVIPFLLGPNDLAACDALIHSSVVAGAQWAHCKRATFRHNDPESLDTLLTRSRAHAERVLVVLEGVYSMDGDIAALPELVAVARKHDCLVMVDEAHSFGTLGEHGWGAREHFGLPGDAVDLWMGTLSKALAGCGGFLAGDADLIWAIRMLAPGICLFVTPPTPAQVAAATAAYDLMLSQPDRLTRLRTNAATAVRTLQAGGWDTGTSDGTPIVPIILGDTERTMTTSGRLLRAGINAAPIAYPAVAEGEARIRLFLSADHTAEQLDTLVSELASCDPGPR